MNKVVKKFGGTSVQDSTAMKNVINITRSDPDSGIIVVSAIAKATNTLEQIAHLSSEGKREEAIGLMEELTERHKTIIKELIKEDKFNRNAREKIEKYFNNLKELITGVSIVKELTLRTLDAFRVFGELMSSAVIFNAMKSEGIDAELVDSREIIKTNNDFSRAYPDFALTQKNADEQIKPLLKKGKIIVTQGFIASTEDGIPTTMGRESSDFSGVIYGSVINAKEIQIWTDVDGVLTADPNIVKQPYKLSMLSFPEMEELSNFGAKVLHKNSVKPALKKNIPIRILNSKNTSSTGTIVNNELKYNNLIKSITYKKNIIVLRLKPKEDLNQYIFWEMMLNILNRHKPQIDILISSNNAIIIVIAENNYTKIHYEDLKREFEEISDYIMLKEKALITLVGSDIFSVSNLEQRIFICNPGLKPESVISGYNSHSFSILINTSDLEHTMKNLHREFFENSNENGGLFDKPHKREELIA